MSQPKKANKSKKSKNSLNSLSDNPIDTFYLLFPFGTFCHSISVFESKKLNMNSFKKKSDLLKDILSIFRKKETLEDKRRKLAQKLAISLIGIGAIAGIDFLIKTEGK